MHVAFCALQFLFKISFQLLFLFSSFQRGIIFQLDCGTQKRNHLEGFARGYQGMRLTTSLVSHALVLALDCLAEIL
jgi:hypothetical protein